MAISALAITSSKELGEIAIGEPVDYSVEITGDVDEGEKIAVSIRNADDDSMAWSGRFVHPAASPVTGTIANTWTLKTSRGKLLKEGVDDGDYYLHVETEDGLIEADSNPFSVVILTEWMVRNVYMAGLPFVDGDGAGTPLNAAIITSMIELAIGDLEEDLQIYLYPKTVRTEPTDAEEGMYDVVKDRLTYIWRDMRYVPFINLPSFYVQSIEWLRGYIANSLAIDVPANWLKLSKKRGTVQVVSTNASYTQYVGSAGWGVLFGTMVTDVPKFWDVKYVAGWNENIEQFPRAFLYLIGVGTALKILPILSDAMKRGMTSESISMDGVSESQSAGGKMVLEGRMERYTKEYQDLLKGIKNRYRGPVFTVA